MRYINIKQLANDLRCYADSLDSGLPVIEDAGVFARSSSSCTENSSLLNVLERPETFQPSQDSDLVTLALIAKRVYNLRRKRDIVFDGMNIFADPAWDILLDLFIHRAKGKRVSITSACLAAVVPPTTALRWIRVLLSTDLITRQDDESDRRRSYLILTPRAESMISEVLTSQMKLQ